MKEIGLNTTLRPSHSKGRMQMEGKGGKLEEKNEKESDTDSGRRERAKEDKHERLGEKEG